jgi:hypothetical protein
MYFIWANERTAESQLALDGTPDVIKALDLSFDRGLRVHTDVPLVRFAVEVETGNASLTDNLIAAGMRGLVLSSRGRRTLRRCGVDNIDYYPLVLVDPAHRAIDDYQIANLIGRPSCIDLVKSDVEMHPDMPDTIEFINSLTLTTGSFGTLRMFRAAEHAQVIVVHEEVKKAWEAERLTGVRFYSPEDFSL